MSENFDPNQNHYFFNNKDTTPLVFIHGVGLDYQMWDKQVNYFNEFSILTYDLLGHGKTPFNKENLNFNDFSNQLLEFFFDNPLLKRIIYLFNYGIFDASSNERFDIIIRSLNEFDTIQWIFGIGIGYFDNFQELMVGERIAAHNNFLLFFIEGGFFLLIFFILHLIWIGVKILKIKNSEL